MFVCDKSANLKHPVGHVDPSVVNIPQPKFAHMFLFKGIGGCSEDEVLVAVPATAVLTNGLFIAQVLNAKIAPQYT